MPIDADIKNKLSEVKEYILKLKPEQREILIMRLWDDLSYKEISEITGKSEASLKMLFSRVIKTLRKKIPLDILILLLTTLNNLQIYNKYHK